MPLTGAGLQDALSRRYIMKGKGFIPKQRFKQGLKKIRNRSRFPENGLSDEDFEQCIKAGFRVYDKRRGIYVHI